MNIRSEITQDAIELANELIEKMPEEETPETSIDELWSTGKMKVEIDKRILAELEYMIELHEKYGAPARFNSVSGLVNYILASVADGHRRPGSWEREMLIMMGVIADCDEAYQYRDSYGNPCNIGRA